MSVYCRACFPPTGRGRRLPGTKTYVIISANVYILLRHSDEISALILPICAHLHPHSRWDDAKVAAGFGTREQLKVSGRGVYLEQAAADNCHNQQHVFIRHVSSGHSEGRGWDVKPVVRHRFCSLQKQEYISSWKQDHSEFHVHGDKIWSHVVWHVYPPTDKVEITSSYCTIANSFLKTPIKTHLFSYNTSF